MSDRSANVDIHNAGDLALVIPRALYIHVGPMFARKHICTQQPVDLVCDAVVTDNAPSCYEQIHHALSIFDILLIIYLSLHPAKLFL